MLAVALDLLTGRFGATVYNDRRLAEWPPHPARLFSAFVATWADADEPNPDERAVLAWLEQQPAPQLVCSGDEDLARRHAVTVYVPSNDPTALRSSVDSRAARLAEAEVAARQATTAAVATRARKALQTAQVAYREAAAKAARASGEESASVRAAVLELLPENRNRQPRTYPSVTPADPVVRFVWPDADPTPEQRLTLDGLLARVSRIGHSSTLVSCRLDGDPPPATLVPRPGGDVLLRVPRAGLLDRLERDFASHHGRRERVMPAAMAAYGRPSVRGEPSPAGVLSGDWILLPLRTVEDGDRLPVVAITRSLELARATRAALLEHTPPEGSEIVSGIWPDGGHRPHLAVVPLASVGHRWADGIVRGVALMLPRDIDPADEAVVDSAVRQWAASGQLTVALPAGDRDLRLVFKLPAQVPATGTSASPALLDDVPYALRRSTWCRTSRDWVTATPVALDRQPRGLYDPRADVHQAAEEDARAVIVRACRHYGLPEPDEVVLSPVGMAAGVPPARGGGHGRRRYPAFVAAGSGEAKLTVHVRLRFPVAVRGPVLLGAGRYLGYGLFLPVRDAAGGDR
jgi:CRISPR-associated protein Csb2